jgi:hypothetical protein
MQEHEYTERAKAVLEHHFDVHDYCSAFCKRKDMTAQQRLGSERYYRCKTKDAKLYAVLTNILNRFISMDRLQEVAHGMDTQVNESFNNTASWLAPKNKVYCGTTSLRNRISIGVGIVSIGFQGYFRRLYHALGIAMTPNIVHFLEVKDKQRNRRLAKVKTRKAKRERMKRKFDRLRQDELVARKERSKRDGTYKTGMNVAAGASEGYTEAELLEAARKKRPNPKNKVCPHCGLTGHTTKRSSKCKMHTATPAEAVQLAPAVADAPTSNDIAEAFEIGAQDLD